jgi:NADPH:quinone reductase-like Zn-dependent oxidoreductase
MKVVVCVRYGLDNLSIKEIPEPVPGDKEVLVQIHASCVNTNNLVGITGKPFLTRLFGPGLIKPKCMIPGRDFAGIVKGIGRDVKQFRSGDEVFGHSINDGAYAEFISVPENVLALKPVNISFEEAAATPESALVALNALRNTGHIKSGMNVLIYGASGGIGTFSVQIAKSFGAEVTGVCGTGNIEMVRSIGADHVIDYTREDFVKNRQTYDLIHAAVGYRSVFDYKRALSPKGIYVATGGSAKAGFMPMAQIFQVMLIGSLVSEKDGRQLCFAHLDHIEQNDLVFIKELIEAGKVKPVIDRCYPLSKVAEAVNYYGKGHSRGKIAITVSH